MKQQRILSLAVGVFMTFSAFAITSVSMIAFINPQEVMKLIQVKLYYNDAYSSMRGVHCWIGLTIFTAFVYLGFKDQTKGLLLAAFLWGVYAVSRFITTANEGMLGEFGNQWFVIEGGLCITALVLLSFKLRLSEVV